MIYRKPDINIYAYLNYRQFLKDWYEKAKQKWNFSYRNFSKRAGFESSCMLKRVIDGERNLTEQSIEKFAKGLGLTKYEQKYFHNLVIFNQSNDHDQKNIYYHYLLKARKYSKIKTLEEDHLELCSHWYHTIVRELVVSPECHGDPEWIQKRIRPHLTLKQVKDSITLLERIGLIEKRADNYWHQTNSLLTTGSESQSWAVLNYHQSVLRLLPEMIPQIPQNQRDISAMTLGIPAKRVSQLKKKIQDFRQEILSLISIDENPEEVLLLTMQLMPMTQSAEEKKI